jgi:hypothetical protein
MDLVRVNLHRLDCPTERFLDPAGRILLRDLFWSFAKKDIQDLVTYVTPDSMESSLHFPSNDGVIQIYGVLAHLIFDDEGAWYAGMYRAQGKYVVDDHPFVPFRAMEHFMISGGLGWITTSIVRLLSTLLQEEGFASNIHSLIDSTDDNHRSNLNPSGWSHYTTIDQSYADAVQLRIMLLVNLCSRLVMDVYLSPIRFPDGYWRVSSSNDVVASSSFQEDRTGGDISNSKTSSIAIPLPSKLDIGTGSKESRTSEHPLMEAAVENSMDKLIMRIEKKRKECRVSTLFRAFHLLWSSPTQSRDNYTLSPLACLIACYAVFWRDGDLDSLSHLSRTTHDPNTHEMNRNTITFKNYFELPLIPQRREGMDQCVYCLQQMVDPAGNLFFAGATYPKANDVGNGLRSQTDATKKTSLSSHFGDPCNSSDDQTNRKRSRSTSSLCDNPPKKKSNIDRGDQYSDTALNKMATILEEKSRSLLADTIYHDDDCENDHNEDEDIPEEEEEDGHDDAIMVGDIDDEVDHDESDDDDCSDYDHIESAELDEEEDVVTRKVRGSEHKGELDYEKWERLSLSDATFSVIPKIERDKNLIRASMEVLHAQYRQRWTELSTNIPTSRPECHGFLRSTSSPLLTITAEQLILQNICDIVKPPPKPFKMKIVMKRAPTQEEFFRGSLSRNPINIESIKVSGQRSSLHSLGGIEEPSVRDLRQHIATDLNMEDSAELLELLVGNKILGLNLKLRVVSQVIWRKHVMEKAISNSGFSSSFLPSSLVNRRTESRSMFSIFFGMTNDTDVHNSVDDSQLPPMVVTYRLMGVDGEATEERVDDGDLVDPEALNEARISSEENEKLLENQYSLTYIVTERKGIQVLLDSLEAYLRSCMRNIHRDNVGRKLNYDISNPARTLFLKSRPCPSLILLRHCARLKGNRVKMVKCRAPTTLLRILLDLLSCLEESRSSMVDTTRCDSETLNPTASYLQELIETLSSVISEDTTSCCIDDKDYISDREDDASLRVLLSSLSTSYLSVELRSVISKLLPYLTYGQPQLSRYLAAEFVRHVPTESLGCNDLDKSDNASVLMDTFVNCAIQLPTISLCQHFREELLKQNFVSNLVEFLMQQVPNRPPHWCPALFESSTKLEPDGKNLNETSWRLYFGRKGLILAMKILVGISTNHIPTQNAICGLPDKSVDGSLVSREGSSQYSFVTVCHWIESTSDYNNISTCGLGIQAETLLDIMIENSGELKTIILNIRNVTRERKKAIADERRKSLMAMNSFASTQEASNAAFPTCREKFGQLLPGTRKDPNFEPTSKLRVSPLHVDPSKETLMKSKWLVEMESMEDESGLTCVVCQEGRKIVPKELLGLYCFTKKVTLPSKLTVTSIDGSGLLRCFPLDFHPVAWNAPEYTVMVDSIRSAVERIQSLHSDKSNKAIGDLSNSFFVTTVSAGNAIHCSCHVKARVADKNHTKAPKTEWEGATLRNSRVMCNVILPLMSASVSKVPQYLVDSYFEEYTSEIVRLAGSRPQSMLWLILHDLYFLILRMSCGESLTNDCGGGSITSNSLLVFYMLLLVEKYKANHTDAFNHASALSYSLILCWKTIQSNDHGIDSSLLSRLRLGIAEAAPMAAISCILFHNRKNEESDNASVSTRLWFMYRDVFCACLIYTAGHRHALGIEGSGCDQNRRLFTGKRARSTSFNDWDGDSLVDKASKSSGNSLMTKLKSLIGKRTSCPLDQYAKALRPMLALFIVLDRLAGEFSVDMKDEAIDQGAVALANVIESCQRAENLAALMRIGNIPIDKERILDAFDEGYKAGKK